MDSTDNPAVKVASMESDAPSTNKVEDGVQITDDSLKDTVKEEEDNDDVADEEEDDEAPERSDQQTPIKSAVSMQAPMGDDVTMTFPQRVSG